MNIFIPDIYAKNIYAIDYNKLKERSIKCIIFDLDNTIVPIKVNEPDHKIKELLAKLDDLGFKVIIMSNSHKKRLTPFKEGLNVDTAYSSMKPLKRKYKKIMKLYGYKEDEIACIGDQLLTDIAGANRMGFTSIFVEKLADEDLFFTRINRFFERKILRSLNKKGVYEKGKYYD